jgi:hypothetical protein
MKFKLALKSFAIAVFLIGSMAVFTTGTALGQRIIQLNGDDALVAAGSSLTCRDSFSDCTEGACGNASWAAGCSIKCRNSANNGWFFLECKKPTGTLATGDDLGTLPATLK